MGEEVTDLLHIESGFRTRLNEHDIQFLRFLLSLLFRHLPLVLQISLVADQHDDDVVSALCAYVVNPFGRLVE